ncbi:hypothetical protein NDN01_15385 [Sphingomonas sp. QA11]|uniref:hypothetical protein n=1 Tax=Sphingomonas sp. QA11 TaxID=2950605 RepID=UPI00234A443E|nr:hypothetical protein [Sphingomonas sp. QA11]WCM25439.1 hypothetical protein NDN01_15385 [Sphingomonas sp. QA11]
MLKTVVGSLATLCVMLPSSAASAADIPSASNALTSAISACSVAAATGRFETTSPVAIYMNMPRSMGRVQSINDTPDIVRRYIATSAAGVPPQFVYQFKTSTGGVWAVLRSWVDRCDIIVSGLEDRSVGDGATNAFADNAGWRPALKGTATHTTPPGRVSFVKSLPQPRYPNYGIAASVTNLGTTADKSDGVQLEINIMAGDVLSSANTIDVKTIRPAINPVMH